MAQSKKVASKVATSTTSALKSAADAKLTHAETAKGKPAVKQTAKTTKVPPAPAQSPAQSKVSAKPPAKAVKSATPAVSASAPVKSAPANAAAPAAAKAPPAKAAPAKAAPAKAAPAKAVKAPLAAAAKPAAAMPAAVAKPAAQRISAPVVVKPPAAPAAAAPASAGAAKKPISAKHGFKTNEYIVYPAHGVGRIVGIEEQEIAGMALELFVITFDKDKMTLRVPTGKLSSVGMRKLAEEPVVRKAMETLKGRARVKRTMWSRRAQEYEAKINSGDLVAIAEVVRDLYRSETQPEQSYSERQLYEAALDRMAREIAAVEKLDERGAVQRITEVLSKSAKVRRVAAEGAEAAEAAEAEAGDDDADVKAA
jgi:CarD family transcriptional regulator